MGYDLPAIIGAYFSDNKKDLICITGDGSIMMNLQELQTISGYKIPATLESSLILFTVSPIALKSHLTLQDMIRRINIVYLTQINKIVQM